MKEKALIFGAGQNYFYSMQFLQNRYEIMGILDNSSEKWGKRISGVEISPVSALDRIPYDFVIVTPKNRDPMIRQLLSLGVPAEKIVSLNDLLLQRFDVSPARICVAIHGGIGDYLIAGNWLAHLAARFLHGDEIVDVFAEEPAMESCEAIFRDSGLVSHIYGLNRDFSVFFESRNADAVLSFCLFPYVVSFDGARLAALNPPFMRYLSDLRQFGYEHYCPGFFTSSAYLQSIRNLFDRYPQKKYHTLCDVFENLGIDDTFTIPFQTVPDGEAYLRENGLDGRRFITIDTGSSQLQNGTGGTKAWPRNCWNRLSSMLRRAYGDYLIVQVGVKLCEEDDIEADVHLNGKTNVEQIKILMKYAALHIDYEGGLVHIRHVLGGGPSVVLFGPTSPERHAYPENISIYTGRCPSDCESTTNQWLFECPRGLAEPECMTSIRPEYVFERTAEALENLSGQTR